jgi:competence protein ComEA
MPDLSKEQLYIILGVIAVVLFGCVIGVYNTNFALKQSSPVTSPNHEIVDIMPKNKPDGCFVHISGAVVRQGVYKVYKGDRIVDILNLSGVLPDADLDSVNLAETLSDGEKVVIPYRTGKADIKGQASSAKMTGKTEKMVNINTADEKGFDSLPGIGPVMAKKMLDYRAEKGRFSNIEELKEVPGISVKKFDKLKSLISVN